MQDELHEISIPDVCKAINTALPGEVVTYIAFERYNPLDDDNPSTLMDSLLIENVPQEVIITGPVVRYQAEFPSIGDSRIDRYLTMEDNFCHTFMGEEQETSINEFYLSMFIYPLAFNGKYALSLTFPLCSGISRKPDTMSISRLKITFQANTLQLLEFTDEQAQEAVEIAQKAAEQMDTGWTMPVHSPFSNERP